MNRRPCAGPWKTPTIDSQGNLTVCCHDKRLNYKLGNLTADEFDEIWFGEKADQIRGKHLLGEFDKLGDKSADHINCGNCNGFESPKITDEEVISYLQQVGKEKLTERYLNRVCKGWNRIESLLIELTDTCNLKCVMCRQGMEHAPEGNKGFMGFDLWKSIFEDLESSQLRVKALTPFWYGEPLMHPEFLKMAQFAFKLNYNKEYDKRLSQIQELKDEKILKDFLDTHPFNNRVFDYMELHTNGVLLTKDIMDYLFSDEAVRSLGYLVFSVDALHEETYKKIRRGGDFIRVMENLKYCLSLKAKIQTQGINQLKKLVRPVIVIQFIVMPENADEAEGFVDYWKKYLDDLGLPCQINGGYEPPFLKDTIFLRVLGDIEPRQQPEAWKLHEDVISRSKHFTKEVRPSEPTSGEYIRRPCAGPWKTPVIRWDGSIGVCCYDYKMELKLGNVKERKLSWLWNMDKVMRMRLEHVRGNFLSNCDGCPNLDSPQISDAEVVEYLRVVRSDEILPYLRRVKNYHLMRDFI